MDIHQSSPSKKGHMLQVSRQSEKNSDESVNKYNARLVAKRFHQQRVFQFHEIFSSIVKPTLIHVTLNLSVTYKQEIQQIDIDNAFLNGKLHEKVYMYQPLCFIDLNPVFVYKINKAIYSLKQAPHEWYKNYTMHTFNLDLSQAGVITLYLCVIIIISHSMQWYMQMTFSLHDPLLI